MGIRKELERLGAEEQAKQEKINQEKLVIIGKIKERLGFLNEEARALVRPHLQVLQQSGAIEVLMELKEAAGIEDEVEINAAVSYLCPIRRGKVGKYGISEIRERERRNVYFRGEEFVEGNEFFNFGEDNDYKKTEPNYNGFLEYSIGSLHGTIETLSLISPKDFKVNSCSVELGCYHNSGRKGGYYEASIWYENKTLLFCSLWPEKAVKLVKVTDDFEPRHSYDNFYPRHNPRDGVDLFCFSEEKWGEKALLEKKVAQAYYALKEDEGR